MVAKARQPARPDSLESPAARPAPHPGAVRRSRSNHSEERAQRRPGAALGVRRALPTAFEAAADPGGAMAPYTVSGAAVALGPRTKQSSVPDTMVARGRPGPERRVAVQHRETNRRYEVHIDILRGELNAAMQMMEYRERWWTTGLHNAEAAVGLEMSRVHASEVAASEGMEAQMAALLNGLRTAQSRAGRQLNGRVGAAEVGERSGRVRKAPHRTRKDDDHQF